MVHYTVSTVFTSNPYTPISTLLHQNSALEEMKREKEVALEDLRRQLETKLETDTHSLHEKLSKEISELKQRLSEKASELTSALAEVDSLRAAMAEREKGLGTVSGEVKRLRGEIGRMEGELRGVQGRWENTRRENEQLKVSLNSKCTQLLFFLLHTKFSVFQGSPSLCTYYDAWIFLSPPSLSQASLVSLQSQREQTLREHQQELSRTTSNLSQQLEHHWTQRLKSVVGEGGIETIHIFTSIFLCIMY